jgi:hypothetical protein
LATHRIDKIVQIFDTKTGQVHKDNKGELRIQEVVDWPVIAGLKGGAKLNNLFKWAEHLNNYQPLPQMDTVPGEGPKDYHPLCYQTKAFDKCTKSLSVFTQDEREFLEQYHWLCHVLKLFKPEDLLCVLSNAEAEKEAQENLKNFELENERIRWPDASSLHNLIPYVKRLVRHFPHIKKEIKDKLSSSEIINKVCQDETQRHLKQIHPNAPDFNDGALRLKEFLQSDQQIGQLRMTDEDSWTAITKLDQVLQNTSCMSNYNSEGHCTILDLKRLQTVHQVINVNALLESIETPHLLMIACGTNQPVNDELENMFWELFSILENKKGMKIILTTQSDGDFADFIQQIATETLGEGFITTDEQLTWSDLTDSSQTAILEKTVIFQGKGVALNQLISAESMTGSFPLAELLQEKELKIGEEPVPSACSGYNEKYYIDRTFNHNIIIRQDILNDKKAGKFVDLFASTELEFKQLCQQNTKSNVHWLEKKKSGEIIWQQSRGNLRMLRGYIVNQKSHSYAPEDLDKLLEEAKKQRVMLTADKAGMGKTTVLTHLSRRIKQKYPAHWLARIDLNDYTELLVAQRGKKMDKERVLEFV